MKLALEYPSDLLDKIQPLADYDFILTHLVLQDEVYARYHAESTKFKILDNSTNELLTPCSLDDIARAAAIVRPDYIMPPDFLGDALTTEIALGRAISRFGREKIYPIIQGALFAYALECFDHVAGLGFDKVAVPYDICCLPDDTSETKARRRLEVVNKIISVAPRGFSIHLLGMNTLAELCLHMKDWVKSIDTGYPVMCGMYGYKFGVDELLPKKGPTLSMMKSAPCKTELKVVYYNIAYLRRILNEH